MSHPYTKAEMRAAVLWKEHAYTRVREDELVLADALHEAGFTHTATYHELYFDEPHWRMWLSDGLPDGRKFDGFAEDDERDKLRAIVRYVEENNVSL